MMNKEKAVEIFDLVIKNRMLPEKIEDLVPLSFIGQTAVSFYREKVALMDRLGLAEDQKRETLRDGQDAGKMLLTIEARIGELLPTPAEAQKLGGGGGSTPRTTRPKGISERRARTARTIKDHPEAVAEVIREAEENEDIPTKTAVLNKIAYREEKKIKEQLEQNEAIMEDDARKYLGAIRRAYRLIADPPKSISEDAFSAIKKELLLLKKKIEAILG